MSQRSLTRKKCVIDAGPIGWLEGVTVVDETQSTGSKPLCHYFGGVPYGLPPVEAYRFRQSRPLPEHHRYGSRSNPGRFTGRCGVCPQPNSKGPTAEKHWDESLELNIYIPPGDAPSKGWPVFFYIHGGFLQWGAPNMSPEAVAPLLSETAFRAIIVAPGYRVNALGFLASRELQTEAQTFGEPVGNQGFWDQRLALEWTAQRIGRFGGDADNITVGGYSAGAHSAFQQLAYELYRVQTCNAIIRRVIMWSNSPGVQPRSLQEAQTQFDELLDLLHISSKLPANERLAKLRAVPPAKLVVALDKMKMSEFRALSDGAFVDEHLVRKINSGDFARRMKARGIKLMNGENRDERFSYATWRPLTSDTYAALYSRLCADFPQRAVKALMHHHFGEKHVLPAEYKDWQEAFGHLYANMQVHALERGFHNALVNGGLEPGKDLLRYRFDWRSKNNDALFPREWGVTHATDMTIWFWGMGIGSGLTDEEKNILKPWNERFAAFVNGDDPQWGTKTVTDMLRLDPAGRTDNWTDDRWEQDIRVWDVVNGSPSPGLIGWIRSRL